jgi:hypothetical protein
MPIASMDAQMAIATNVRLMPIVAAMEWLNTADLTAYSGKNIPTLVCMVASMRVIANALIQAISPVCTPSIKQ